VTSTSRSSGRRPPRLSLTGQAVVLPGPGVPSSVAHAFLEGVRFGLGRLAVALGRSQPATLGPLAARFRLSCTAREICRGATPQRSSLRGQPTSGRSRLLSTPPGCRRTACPAPLRLQAKVPRATPASMLPLTCARRCLGIRSWRCPRKSSRRWGTALGVAPWRSTALAATASAMDGPWNSSMATPPAKLSRTRSRGAASTRPYITDAICLASLAEAVSAAAATASRPSAAGADGRYAIGGAAPRRALPAPAELEPLHRDAPAGGCGFTAWLAGVRS
jgi:hypothetical protein